MINFFDIFVLLSQLDILKNHTQTAPTFMGYTTNDM